MKRLRTKLRGKTGESLVETLCAILIFTLASVGMYTMILTANRINSDVREKDRGIQEQLIIVEKAEGTAEGGTVTVTLTDGKGNEQTFGIDVEVYRTEDLSSYFKAKGGSEWAD